MSKINQETKNAIVNYYYGDGEKNKAKTAREFNISPRSIGRIIASEPTPDLKNLMNEDYDNVCSGEDAPNIGGEIEDSNVTVETESVVPDNVTIVNWTGGLSFISLVLSNGDTISIDGNDERYKPVKEALWNEDLDAALEAADKTTVIREWSKNNIDIKRGELWVHGKRMTGSVVEHIVQAFENDRPFEKYVNFYINLLQNPSDDSINQLLPFMKHNDIDVDENGNIIAWKYVNSNYTDCYSRRIRNKVGDKPWMPRAEVNSNKHQTCSYGYHVCAKTYLPSNSGYKYMKCRIEPKDVVSVPNDYNGAKMRVCSYEVIEEVTDKWLNNEL